MSEGRIAAALPRSAADIGELSAGMEPRQPGLGGMLAVGGWCGFVLLAPFYVFGDKLPQPADCLIALLCGLLPLMGRLRIARTAVPVMNAIGLFVAYGILVNVIWFLKIGDYEFLQRSSYLTFNLAACLVFTSLVAWFGTRVLTWTAAAVAATLFLQVALSRVFDDGSGRALLFFNNPNQLGYFALLFAVMYWAWSESRPRYGRWMVLVSVAVYLSALYLSLLSVSRAAVGSLIVMLLLACFRQRRVALVTGVVAIGLALTDANWSRLEFLQNRIDKRSQGAIAEGSQRGYDRIVEYPEMLLLGAGEGAFHRFQSNYRGEMHSTVGTILFSYGIVGLALFLHCLWLLARGCGAHVLLYFVPALCYGLTHNGLRQAEFWLLMPLIACLHWRDDGSNS